MKLSAVVGVGTNLSTALKEIPEVWIKDKKVYNVYVFTDGEICDNNIIFKTKIQKHINNYSRIFITTIEPNKINYLIGNTSAGNKIYRTLNESRMMKHVKLFESFNCFHFNKFFISLPNPDVVMLKK
jgi:hypothetical protein